MPKKRTCDEPYTPVLGFTVSCRKPKGHSGEHEGIRVHDFGTFNHIETKEVVTITWIDVKKRVKEKTRYPGR
jgi:hypothetical protein